jgi:hypothetical protein
MKFVVGGIMVFVVLGVLRGTAYAQRMKLGEVLVVHVPDLKPDADMQAFERYVLREVAPAWKKAAPGMELHLVRADRGRRKGQYMLAWTTDTQNRWKAYASASGASPFARALHAKVGDFHAGFQPFVNGGGQYHEYHLIGPDKTGTLPDVEILGIHYTKARPERRAAFETFIAEKVHPAVANLRPDIGVLYYKSVRGPDEGDYLAVFALTTASRDKYWPGGSDSDALRAAFSPAIRELAKELSAYLVEGSYAADPKLAAAVYESREWTDFVVVR